MDHIVNVRGAELTRKDLEAVRSHAGAFCERWAELPASRLLITVNAHARKGDFHVKATACLASGREFTGSRGVEPVALVGDCLDKLTEKIDSLIERLDGFKDRDREEARRARENAALPDVAGLQEAVDKGDAVAFRQVLSDYDDQLGRILKPKIRRRLDDGREARLTSIAIDYLYLTAFEEYEHRPGALLFKDWLFGLTEEVVHELALRPEEIESEVMHFRSAGGSDSA